MKPFATYGKKPRGSKTSKRSIILGIPVFLHYTASNGKILNVYHDVKPFPRIITTAGNSYWDCVDKAEKFFSDNIFEIEDKLKTLNHNYGIPKDILDKAIMKSFEYKIYETNPGLPNHRLLVCGEIDNYVYLYVDINDAPTINVKAKKIPDKHKIYEEFLKRKKDLEGQI